MLGREGGRRIRGGLGLKAVTWCPIHVRGLSCKSRFSISLIRALQVAPIVSAPNPAGLHEPHGPCCVRGNHFRDWGRVWARLVRHSSRFRGFDSRSRDAAKVTKRGKDRAGARPSGFVQAARSMLYALERFSVREASLCATGIDWRGPARLPPMDPRAPHDRKRHV